LNLITAEPTRKPQTKKVSSTKSKTSSSSLKVNLPLKPELNLPHNKVLTENLNSTQSNPIIIPTSKAIILFRLFSAIKVSPMKLIMKSQVDHQKSAK
jgi:hypothetical protein